MSDTLIDTIEENALGPKRAQGDSGSIEQHPLPDQIAAAKFLADRAAQQNANRGLRFTKLICPE